MKRRLIIYNTLTYVFLGLQIISYLANAASNNKLPEDPAERMGHYFGLQIFGLISFIFFISANQLRKKIKKTEESNNIDSIGKGI